MTHISLKALTGDARDEAFERARQMPGYPPFTQVPSPNLAAFIAKVETGKLAPLRELADRIERGRATESEDEIDTLYDSLDMLLNCVEDLIGMCRRREEALAECGIRIGKPWPDADED